MFITENDLSVFDVNIEKDKHKKRDNRLSAARKRDNSISIKRRNTVLTNNIDLHKTFETKETEGSE